MLTLKQIQENTEAVIAGLKIKNFDAEPYIKQILAKDEDRRNTQKEQDDLLSQINVISKQVGQLFKEGKTDEANEMKKKSAELGEKQKALGTKLDAIATELNDILVRLPNLPYKLVKPGKGAEDNEIVKLVDDTIPNLPADAKPHWELAKDYNLIDFELGVKITGAGFPVYKGMGAKLQRALISFFLDENTKAGFLEIEPPLMVNEASARANFLTRKARCTT